MVRYRELEILVSAADSHAGIHVQVVTSAFRVLAARLGPLSIT